MKKILVALMAALLLGSVFPAAAAPIAHFEESEYELTRSGDHYLKYDIYWDGKEWLNGYGYYYDPETGEFIEEKGLKLAYQINENGMR